MARKIKVQEYKSQGESAIVYIDPLAAPAPEFSATYKGARYANTSIDALCAQLRVAMTPIDLVWQDVIMVSYWDIREQWHGASYRDRRAEVRLSIERFRIARRANGTYARSEWAEEPTDHSDDKKYFRHPKDFLPWRSDAPDSWTFPLLMEGCVYLAHDEGAWATLSLAVANLRAINAGIAIALGQPRVSGPDLDMLVRMTTIHEERP